MTVHDPKPDLPAVPAAAQPELFDAELVSCGRELLLSEEAQRHQFTTEVIQRNRERFCAILRALGEGMPLNAIARAYAVSRNTLGAIIARHPHLVEQERRMAAGRFAVLARACSERLLDQVDSLPSNVVGIVMGIATDKSLLLDGRPTAITETKRGPTADELNAYIDSLPRAQVGASDAQSDEIGQVTLRLAGPVGAGLQSGAGSDVQKGSDVQVDGDQAGATTALGAPDPAPEQGGGGGARARAGGA